MKTKVYAWEGSSRLKEPLTGARIKCPMVNAMWLRATRERLLRRPQDISPINIQDMRDAIERRQDPSPHLRQHHPKRGSWSGLARPI